MAEEVITLARNSGKVGPIKRILSAKEKSDLLSMEREYSFRQIGMKFKVSHATVRTWLREIKAEGVEPSSQVPELADKKFFQVESCENWVM
jgi:transposase